MRQHCVDVLSRIVPECTIALFSTCGVSLRSLEHARAPQPGPRREEIPTVAGVVGFHGKHLSGTLTIASTFEFIERIRMPKPERSLSPERSSDWLAIRDWASELANQLLGRIKGRLFVLNVPLQAGTPTALSGATLMMTLRRSAVTHPHVFSAGDRQVSVYFDAQIDPQLDLTGCRNDLLVSAKEGELILF